MPIELQIESIAKGGEAVAHHEGRVVFVDRAAPGDRVEAELVEEKGRSFRARALRVIEPGPARVEPACSLAERCGGCGWMHVTLEAQRAAKERIFYDCLERIGNVRRSDLDAKPIAFAPEPLGYRRRTRLHVRRGRLGYLREGTSELVEARACPVLEPALDRVLRTLADALEREGLLARVKDIDLLCAGEAWSLALHVPRVTGALRDRAGRFIETAGARGAVLVPEDGPASLVGQPALGTLRPDLFAQASAGGNALLVGAVVGAVKPRAGLQLLELFAGSGNFTLPLAEQGCEICAVESMGPALALAREAADARGLGGRVRFMAGDALDLSRALAREGRRFETLVLDPPRAGCSGLAPHLRSLGITRAVYVSCDPATLSRDLAELRGAGLRPVWAQPIDLFPQTPHLEGIVRLEGVA